MNIFVSLCTSSVIISNHYLTIYITLGGHIVLRKNFSVPNLIYSLVCVRGNNEQRLVFSWNLSRLKTGYFSCTLLFTETIDFSLEGTRYIIFPEYFHIICFHNYFTRKRGLHFWVILKLCFFGIASFSDFNFAATKS